MKLRELKCKNCGATLEVEENVKQVECEFCHSSFAVEDAYSEGYNYEKGRMKAQDEQIEKNVEHAKNFLFNNPITKVFTAHFIISSIIAVAVFLFIFITAIVMFTKSTSKPEDTFNKDNVVNEDVIDNEVVEEIEDKMEEYEITRFNSNFEIYKGTEYGTSVGRLIDEISTNNKKDKKHQVTFKFKETSTTDPEEMKNIKKQLGDWTKYEVTFEYNDDGLIYLATVEE